jgi:hypothetical protein
MYDNGRIAIGNELMRSGVEPTAAQIPLEAGVKRTSLGLGLVLTFVFTLDFGALRLRQLVTRVLSIPWVSVSRVYQRKAPPDSCISASAEATYTFEVMKIAS